ncbi:MAG TPA: SUMF1/EgtB/PvdO family nonheme iron enzyme [Anaerolineales bacterium]|nr:SUMF1/EgtB/PvdO family nonheme iron enzyme [Anaerolineales bacterium]
MSQTPRPLKVFLCHSHSDRTAVRALYSRLVLDGVDAWLDKEKLLPGQEWELEIRRAVRESDVVVICLSNQFNQAGFRQKEVRLALDTAMEKPEGEIFIIPARLEECESLASLSKWQWVDLFEENGYEKLLRALVLRSDRIRANARSLMRFDAKAEKRRQVVFLVQQAEKMEKDADWMAAIENYRQVNRIDPAYFGVEEKIASLQQKMQAGTVTVTLRQDAVVDKPSSSKWLRVAGIVGVLLLCCMFVVAGGTLLYSQFRKSSAQIAPSPVVATASPSLPEPSPTPGQPAVVSTQPVTPEMVLIPAGDFNMGSEGGDADELPIHLVRLDAYSIDVYEVTNAAYQACVDASICKPPISTGSLTREEYYGVSEYENFPVINIDWDRASTFCAWRGGRLPTEAEWEKAARGTDNRIYPWGDAPDCAKSNCTADTLEVGSFGEGKSPYGVYNMAGNVWEWVADWYSREYYSISPLENPQGPSSGESHVLRGGAFDATERLRRVSVRGAYFPEDFFSRVGFRCAADAP